MYILKPHEFRLKHISDLEAKIESDITSTEIGRKSDVEFPVNDVSQLSVEQFPAKSDTSPEIQTMI